MGRTGGCCLHHAVHEPFNINAYALSTPTGKKTVADVAIVRRIHFIYDRATRKFKSDVQLWMTWIEFCKKSKSSKQLSKVIRYQADHVHPIC